MGSLPRRIYTIYYHLNYLWMDIDFRYTEQILATLFVCKSSPNLQKLTISSCPPRFGKCWLSNDQEIHLLKESEDWSWDEKELDYSFDRLQYFDVSVLFGIVPEVEFIRCLLANSPGLLSMRIKIDRSADSEKSRIFKTLMGFQRASAQARLRYLGHC